MKPQFDPKNYSAIPLYRELLAESLEHGTPLLLTKKRVAQNFPSNWVTPSVSQAMKDKQLEFTTTSGTTSDRMQIMRKKGWWRGEYERTSRFNPFLNRAWLSQSKKAILTTAVCSNTACYLDTPSFENRIIGNTLYLNATFDPNAWTKKDIERICDELAMFQPVHLDADPIYLAIFLKKRVQYGLAQELYQPQFMTLSYEFVPKSCRELIQEFFPIPTFNLYGSTEVGYLFCECESGHLHWCSDGSQLEFVPVDAERGLAKLIVSSVKNETMPFLNYEIGDLVFVANPLASPKDGSGEKPCEVSSDVPIAKLAGRLKDALFDQRVIPVSEVDDCVSSASEKFIVYRLDVLTRERMTLRYVLLRDQELSGEGQKRIAQSLKALFAREFEVVFKREASLSPAPSGKFALIKKSEQFECTI